MRIARACSLLFLIAAVPSWLGPPLEACGSKILVLTHGTRFERPGGRHPSASVAIYAPAESEFPHALATLPVVATLERGGYTTTVIRTVADLDAAVQRGGVDVLLIDLTTTKTLDGRPWNASTAPAIVPVVFSEDRADVKQAIAQFHCAVRSPSHSQSFFEAIDQAVSERRAAARR